MSLPSTEVILSGDGPQGPHTTDWPPFTTATTCTRIPTMKKIVLIFGLISGLILATLMSISMAFHDEVGGGAMGLVIGYTSMVLSGLLIYFGVRQYRDTIEGGTVRFWRAAKVGALIAFIAATFYVATWEVIYTNFMPDFMEKYSAKMVEEARAEGATEAAIAAKQVEAAKWVDMYKNPLLRVAMTYMEPLPVALIMVLGSAGLLSRKKRDDLPLATA